MKLLIKNMVSLRCKMIVKSELEKLGYHFIIVELGEVEIMEELSSKKQALLKAALLNPLGTKVEVDEFLVGGFDENKQGRSPDKSIIGIRKKTNLISQ